MKVNEKNISVVANLFYINVILQDTGLQQIHSKVNKSSKWNDKICSLALGLGNAMVKVRLCLSTKNKLLKGLMLSFSTVSQVLPHSEQWSIEKWCWYDSLLLDSHAKRENFHILYKLGHQWLNSFLWTTLIFFLVVQITWTNLMITPDKPQSSVIYEKQMWS